jgi:AraC-like DNA-binding protein
MLRRAASDEFGTYHDLYSVASSVSQVGDRFEATVMGRRAAGLFLFDRQVAGVVHQREASRARRDGLEHLNLQVLRSGQMLAGVPGNERLLAAGDAVLFDTTLPQRTILHDADYVTVTLPREVVEAVAPDFRILHGAVLSREACPGLGEAVLTLARGASETAGAGLGGSALIASLIAAAMDRSGRCATDRDGEEIETARRLRASLFIDAHLGRHDLDVGVVAAGSGVSRSALYRAFAPVGGVKGEIVRRRVARLRSAILRGDGRTPIATLAWTLGFASASHGSRAFAAAYGVPPGQFRDAMLRPEDGAVGDLKAEHMRGLVEVLNAKSSKA